jgi:hypothetical protein
MKNSPAAPDNFLYAWKGRLSLFQKNLIQVQINTVLEQGEIQNCKRCKTLIVAVYGNSPTGEYHAYSNCQCGRVTNPPVYGTLLTHIGDTATDPTDRRKSPRTQKNT